MFLSRFLWNNLTMHDHFQGCKTATQRLATKHNQNELVFKTYSWFIYYELHRKESASLFYNTYYRIREFTILFVKVLHK